MVGSSLPCAISQNKLAEIFVPSHVNVTGPWQNCPEDMGTEVSCKLAAKRALLCKYKEKNTFSLLSTHNILFPRLGNSVCGF